MGGTLGVAVVSRWRRWPAGRAEAFTGVGIVSFRGARVAPGGGGAAGPPPRGRAVAVGGKAVSCGGAGGGGRGRGRGRGNGLSGQATGASALGFWCGEGWSRCGSVGRVGFCGRGAGGLGGSARECGGARAGERGRACACVQGVES